MEQPIPSPIHNQAISTREVDLSEVFEFTKQTWKNSGPHIIKSMIPVLAPIVFLQYVLFAIPDVVALFPVLGWMAGMVLSLLLWPFRFALGVVLQAAIFGMNRPISRIALHGKSSIPANESFLSLTRQNLMGLLLFSLAAGIAASIGTCMLVIPGIIVGIIAQPAGYLVATRGLSIGDAVRSGIEVIKANPIPVLVYHGIFIGLGFAVSVPFYIVIFALYFGLSYISNFAGNLMLAAIYPTMMLTMFPVFAFVFATLYAKLIDGNPQSTPALAHEPNPQQQPQSGSGW